MSPYRKFVLTVVLRNGEKFQVTAEKRILDKVHTSLSGDAARWDTFFGISGLNPVDNLPRLLQLRPMEVAALQLDEVPGSSEEENKDGK